ncbi:MAG: dynamin family protein [Clostridia bacterium]|nr:dynamin family protein [Clostridia bacterium]
MNTAVFKEAVSKLDGQLDKLLEIAQSTGTQQDVVEKIKALKEKNQSKNFKVLVMGEFSAGKSTMINALIGEPILPERALTATAIITEIKYGADKKAVIYPIKGRWKGGDAPFEVPVTELRKYLLINHNIGDSDGKDANTMEGNVIASPFERAEVFMPLDILKDGVEIIDSPGLNDPASHGDITHKYLPNVHAIIYCVNGLRAYSQSEKVVIENLILKHYTTPIFLVTRYDNVCEDNENSGGDPEELEIFRKTVTADLAKHTDLVKPQYTSMLDGNGIFFVSSRDAKKAKHSSPWNTDLLKESGYQDFERYLSDYLIKCKGDELSKMIVEGIRTVGNDAIKSLNEQYNAADLSLEEFEQRIKDVKARMESAKAQAELFVESFELELENALTELKSTCKAMPKEAFDQVDKWRSTYQCSVKKEMLHPKRTAEAIAKEFEVHMQGQYESFTVDWTENVLKPEVSRKMKKIGEKLKNRANDLDETINDIKVGLNLTHTSPDEMSSTGSKVASVVYGLLTFDLIGASSGMAVGMDGLIQGIVANIGINLAILLVFGSTVGLPVIIAGEIAQILISGGRNKAIMEKKVCNKIVEEYKRILSDPAEVDTMINNIYNQLKSEFAKLSEEAKESAFADIKQIERETKQLLDDKKKGEEAVQARKANITTWIADINTIIDNADKIRTDALA